MLKELFLGKLEISEAEKQRIIQENIRDCQRHLRLSDEKMRSFLEFLEIDS